MSSKIIDIYETTNKELKRSGIITQEEYVKIFSVYVRHDDGIIQNLYFGWAKGWDTTPLIEGETLEHYDGNLHRRIEQFASKYHDLLINDVSIKEVIKMDKDNILEIDKDIPKVKCFSKLKSMFKRI